MGHPLIHRDGSGELQLACSTNVDCNDAKGRPGPDDDGDDDDDEDEDDDNDYDDDENDDGNDDLSHTRGMAQV